ncbi:hypothetical protein CANARDRAFT_28131 [[Candida] arabinofermentans NRRL YB-2248]|uniref:Uncharacterized protein n=1 Tax=[Candida] arabinofermentans NRRL YB-2248 TaxID=983967 RepID=A0A1E4T2Y9_9ASCO|nr:hypothetical protein CANARDRAFT_28131 [[Candida] arabinofermentans NRRL YB-2248]
MTDEKDYEVYPKKGDVFNYKKGATIQSLSKLMKMYDAYAYSFYTNIKQFGVL